MTCGEIRDRLDRAGIEDAEFEARLLVREILGVPDYEILSGGDYRSEKLDDAVSRREKREPLQYILGKWWFYGREFYVDRSCLCPRPDTETLVEAAVKEIPEGGTFCDIGTGSGAIAVSVLCERPDLACVAVDISPGALAAAEKNARKHGVFDRCAFAICDALDPEKLNSLGRFDAVLSNPPYIPSEEINGLSPEVLSEPRAALDGGGDGLDFYRSILSCEMLKDERSFYMFEIGKGQYGGVLSLAAKKGLGGTPYFDLSGIKRVIKIR